MSIVSGRRWPTLKRNKERSQNERRTFMPWWEIGVVAVTWLMVRSWRRSKQSVRAAHNFQRSKRSSLLTEQKRNLLADADPTRIGHQSICENCEAKVVVPFRVTRLERRPWRLTWWCQVCGMQARALVPPELVPVLVEWDRAFGTSLSLREVAEFARVDLDEFERAVEDELS